MIAGTRFTSQSLPWGISAVEPERFIAECQLTASTELMQGKGNRPLPLHPIPKTRTKICQLCPRSKLSTICPAGQVGTDSAPKGRKNTMSALSAALIEEDTRCTDYYKSLRTSPQLCGGSRVLLKVTDASATHTRARRNYDDGEA